MASFWGHIFFTHIWSHFFPPFLRDFCLWLFPGDPQFWKSLCSRSQLFADPRCWELPELSWWNLSAGSCISGHFLSNTVPQGGVACLPLSPNHLWTEPIPMQPHSHRRDTCLQFNTCPLYALLCRYEHSYICISFSVSWISTYSTHFLNLVFHNLQ